MNFPKSNPVAKSKKKNGSQKKKNKTKVNRALSSNIFKAPMSYMSNCAKHYALALEDPWNCPLDACVPEYPSFPSRKLRTFVRGSLAIGTAGFGYVVMRPTPANDVAMTASSLSTYTGTNMATANPTVGVLFSNNNSDYVGQSIGPDSTDAMWRPVGAGIRIRYTGTELTRGGTVRLIEAANHANLTGFTVSTIDGFDKSRRLSLDGYEYFNVTWHPTSQVEIQYSTEANYNYSLGIAVSGTAANTFDFEAVLLCELVGFVVRGKTRSDTDPVGLAMVINTTQAREKDGYSGTADHPSILARVYEGAKGTLSGVVSVIKDVANIASAYNNFRGGYSATRNIPQIGYQSINTRMIGGNPIIEEMD